MLMSSFDAEWDLTSRKGPSKAERVAGRRRSRDSVKDVSSSTQMPRRSGSQCKTMAAWPSPLKSDQHREASDVFWVLPGRFLRPSSGCVEIGPKRRDQAGSKN